MSIFSFLKRHIFLASLITIIVIIVAIIVGRSASKVPADTAINDVKRVALVQASTFRQGAQNISVNGTVESDSQADLKSQTSAPVARINVRIGDSVSAGQVIAELQNADIRAQLEQARSSLELAHGQQYVGTVSISSAKLAAIDKIKDAYAKSYDAVITQAQPILYNNQNTGGQLSSYISDTTLFSNITDTFIDLKGSYQNWQTLAYSLDESTSTEVILRAASYSEANLNKTDRLMGYMLEGINDLARFAQPSFGATLSTWKSTITAARTSVGLSQSALTGAQSTLTNSVASQGSTVPAQVSAARAGLNNLEAQLAKTIVRSPISGKIAALPLRQGQLASPGTLVATVVGSNGLQVKAFASEEDFSLLKVGSAAQIQGGISGTVSNVAPSVNSTNKKVEVIINVPEVSRSGLVVGQNVTALIAVPAELRNLASTQNASNQVKYLLPIQNVKIIPGSAFVFTVDDNSKIQRHDVTLGQVKGDFIEVVAGLNDDMRIVTPVYELDEGQSVIVQ